MELLGFYGITIEEERSIHHLLARMTHLSLTSVIEDMTIKLGVSID
jgi:hypothetical protein